MKHYYREMAEIADKLIELGFKFDGLNRLTKNGIGVVFNFDWITISGVGHMPLRRREFLFINYKVDSIIREIIGEIKSLSPKPHWELDGVELEYSMSEYNKTQYIFTQIHMSDCHAIIRPYQYIGNESDFTILLKDGSIKYVKWVK